MHIFYLLRKTARRAQRVAGGGIRFRAIFLAILLALLFVFHVVAMVAFEGLSVGDAAWLTITTATTVGYGDMSAATPAGRWATVLLMYIGGIFILAQLAGLVFESAQDGLERRRKGLVAIQAKDHVVIFGWREAYLRRIVREMRESITDMKDAEIVIVSPNLELLPEDFIKQNVTHVNGRLYDAATLDKVNLNSASRIAILPEAGEEETVYTNLDLIPRLNNFTAPIIYAANNSNELKLAEDLGAADALLFDVNYPEVLARSIITVGGEDIIDEIISRNGVEMVIVQLPLQATIKEIRNHTAAIATLLGIRTGEGDYNLHPDLRISVTDQRLIFLVDLNRHKSDEAAIEAIEAALQSLTTPTEISLFDEPRSVGIIGTTKRATEKFIERLTEELNDQTIQYLGAGVLSASGKWKQDDLRKLDAVVILASEPTDPASDARTYLLIRQLRASLAYTGRIIAEALLPESKDRFSKIGANDILRPVIKNVDILARCIATGAEEVLDNLYSSTGDSELVSLELNIADNWQLFCDRVHEVGLPLAFGNAEGYKIVPPADFVAGRGTVFLLIDTERWDDMAKVRRAVGA